MDTSTAPVGLSVNHVFFLLIPLLIIRALALSSVFLAIPSNAHSIIMAGTSPFTFNSPSFHSSSYLPKLEAEFCRDFSCCGLRLPSLHDLLRHYEEFHAQQTGTVRGDENGVSNNELERQQLHRPQRRDASGMTSPISGMGGIQLGMMQQQQQMQRMKQESTESNNADLREEEEQDGEIAGDMEMDDDMTPPPHTGPLTPQSHSRYPSHPPTPSTHSHPSYQNTPNIPHAQLSNRNINHQPSHFSPESSVPGTPLAADMLDYSFSSDMGMQSVVASQNDGFNPRTSFETGGDMSLDLCIDEPAKRLFSPGGQAMGDRFTQQQLHLIMSGGGK